MMTQDNQDSSSVEQTNFETGSGNVYADLERPDADEMLLKSQLALMIRKAIEVRGISQTEAALLVAMPQPDISAIVRGRLRGISITRLIRVLNGLGCHVNIVVKPAGEGQGAVQVLAG